MPKSSLQILPWTQTRSRYLFQHLSILYETWSDWKCHLVTSQSLCYDSDSIESYMLEQSCAKLNKKHHNLVKMEVLKQTSPSRQGNISLLWKEALGSILPPKNPKNCHVGEPNALNFGFKLHNFKNSFKHKRPINGLYCRR